MRQAKWLVLSGVAIGIGLGYTFAALRHGGAAASRANPSTNAEAGQNHPQPPRSEMPTSDTAPSTGASVVPVGTKVKASGAKRPNIVYMMADNLGYGELGCYGGGILRGAPTPRIDKLAAEGYRLLNFNVEAQCTPSRSALLTGRHAIRSGTYRVNRGGAPYGLVQWEITIAEMLSALGYSTGMFGKWHLGNSPGRYPTDQGFDEWYGIPNSTSVSPWTSSVGFDPKVSATPYILESRRGEAPKNVEVYDLKSRRTIESEITRRTIDFMKRSVAKGQPFFAYVPFTQVHYPTLPNPQFDGKTGNGEFADSLAEMDHRAGQIIDAVKELGIENDTVVVFTSDNGPEEALPHRGWAGPWAGSYFTAQEGSLRVPFIIRLPGRVPAGRISNEIVHQVDIFPTIAKLVGAELPKDRILDGVDQLAFLFGEQEKSNREGFPCYVADVLFAVKWRNWKVHFVWQEYMYDPPQTLPNFRVHNLLTDPRERVSVSSLNTWVYNPTLKIVDEFKESLKREPPIPPGTVDPYVPGMRNGKQE
jgi:arylsulfatase